MDIKKIKIGSTVYSIKDETARNDIKAVKIPAGNSKKPVYFNANGVPTPSAYTLADACAKGVATSVASGNTNLVTSGAVYSALADKGSYEKGTWPAEFNNGGTVQKTATGEYVKIGDMVYVYVSSGVMTTALTIDRISGLPFPVRNTSPTNISALFYAKGNTNTSNDMKLASSPITSKTVFIGNASYNTLDLWGWYKIR